jgi:GTPase SAR1 family protein
VLRLATISPEAYNNTRFALSERSMNNYRLDFLNDKEFEVLVNDLLSVRLAHDIESFKAGKDEGIDGRFYLPDSQQCIIQSKQWERSGYSALISHIRKSEVEKVAKLKPKRYIFATSVPLSRANKGEICLAFSPYILREDDVYGHDDIQSLLGDYPRVAEQHYKLWLASADVLRNIAAAPILGRSKFTLDEIERDVPRFVYTDAFMASVAKLESVRSIIITGQPGIGKTTLAKQLLYSYSAKGFQVVKLNKDVSEAEGLISQDGKQIFYFDDFLGRNYLEALDGALESSVVEFITRIGRLKEKRFVLTSRTVILNRAKTISDVFHSANIEKREFEISIDDLRLVDKAKILYNHLWFSTLPLEFVEALVFEGRYNKLIRHRNYNPRIIDFVTDLEKMSDVLPSDYWAYVLNKLNNPSEIWKGFYERQLNEGARWIVRSIVFSGGSIGEQFLREIYLKNYSGPEVGPAEKALAFSHALELACGAALKRTIHGREPNETRLTLLNPSMGDYIIGRYSLNAEVVFEHLAALSLPTALSSFEAMIEAKLIQRHVFTKIFSMLATRFDQHKEGQVLLLKLSAVITRQQVESPGGDALVKRTLANLQFVDSKTIHDASFHGDIIDLIKHGYTRNFFEATAPAIEELLYKLLESNMSTEIQREFSNLIDLSAIEGKELLSEAFRLHVVQDLSDQIDRMVVDRGVIDEIIDLDDKSTATSSVSNYIRGYLDEFSIPFSDEEADQILDNCDISEIIYGNREVYMQRQSSKPVELPISTRTKESEIDDLFNGGFPPIR